MLLLVDMVVLTPVANIVDVVGGLSMVSMVSNDAVDGGLCFLLFVHFFFII